MHHIYQRRDQPVFTSSEGYQNGVFPNSTANFTIDTINPNETKMPTHESASTEFVRSLDYQDDSTRP